MPWKELDVMKLRIEFAMRAVRGEIPFVKLCKEYGISAKTGYKWKTRFLTDGMKGLEDESRRPDHSPGQVSEDVACSIVGLKRAHENWGPKKICELYARKNALKESLSLSSVRRILDKAGMVVRRRRRSSDKCGRIENRIEAQAPNDVWSVDFKGWWYSNERERIEPLTVRDAYSRYVLCAQVMANSRTETVRSSFEKLFEVYGLPGTIRSDNGPPFASATAPLGLSRLSAWWVALGINLDRIRPGHPEENGAHERMHRDMAQEVESEKQDGEALEMWRQEFNEERPHEALGMKVPAEVYKKGERRYESGKVELTYEPEYLRRKVSACGMIRVEGTQVGVTTALVGWDVGLHAVGKSCYMVWFGKLCLGEIDLEKESFKAVR